MTRVIHITKSTVKVYGGEREDIVSLCGLRCAPNSEARGFPVTYMEWYPINRDKLKGNIHNTKNGNAMCPKCMELVELEIAIHSLSLTVE